MNIKTLNIILKYANPKRSVMLKGWHGIGKTEWVEHLAAEWGLKLVIWHASHAADAGDITGLPKSIKEKIVWYTTDENGQRIKHEEEHEVTVMCPPRWMLQKEPVLLLLDEINRGLSMAMNALMQLTNSQEYDDIKLPEGSRIFSCINPDEDGSYDVSRLDAAQISRFDVYDFTPTVEEWIEWARTHGVHKSIIDFIVAHPRYLDPYTNDDLVHSVNGKDCAKLPDRRAWTTAVSVFVTNGERDHLFETPQGLTIMVQGIAGMVGNGAADLYVNFYANSKNALNPVKIITAKELDDSTLTKIKEVFSNDVTAGLGFIKSCTMYLEDNLSELLNKTNNGKLWSENLYEIINCLTPDCKVTAVSDVIYAAVTERKAWAKGVITLKPEFKELIREARNPLVR